MEGQKRIKKGKRLDALENLENWISKFWSPVPIRAWPSVSEIRQQIQSTPEYAVLLQSRRGVGPKNHPQFKGKSLVIIVNTLIQRVCDNIQSRWAETKFHSLPTVKQIEADFVQVTANESVINDPSNIYVDGEEPLCRSDYIQCHSPDAHRLFYRDKVLFVQWFYQFLQQKISSTLYADKRVFDPNELEFMVRSLHFSWCFTL